MRTRLGTWRRLAAARRGDSDRGSVLIIAFIYLAAVSITVAGLAGWASNDLQNTTKFATARTLQDAARSTAEVAITSIRYTPLLGATQSLNASPPRYCWGSGPSSGLTNVDGYNLNSWCSTTWNPTSAQTRVVTISTCLATVSAAVCAATPLLSVVVTFDDYPPGGSVPISGSCVLWSWCGEGQTINSWIWK